MAVITIVTLIHYVQTRINIVSVKQQDIIHIKKLGDNQEEIIKLSGSRCTKKIPIETQEATVKKQTKIQPSDKNIPEKIEQNYKALLENRTKI